MGRKLAHRLLLIVVVATLMIGGDMVQDGKREIWHIDPGNTVASDHDGSADAVEIGTNIAHVIGDDLLTNKGTCADSRFDR
ncbi:MAG: hypothetical protein WCD37_18500 [Chloroflexia bacterium]